MCYLKGPSSNVKCFRFRNMAILYKLSSDASAFFLHYSSRLKSIAIKATANRTGTRHPPVIMRPSLLRRPAFDVGIPVNLDILRFAVVIPSARLYEKLTPGILNFLRATTLLLIYKLPHNFTR